MRQLELWSRLRSLRLSSLFFFFSASLLLSWKSCPLAIRVEPLYPDYLASVQIETPDPHAACFEGEQLVVQFRGASRLILTVRYGDLSEERFDLLLPRSRGYWTYQLIGENYLQKGGILAYKGELYWHENKIGEVRHHLWVEWI